MSTSAPDRAERRTLDDERDVRVVAELAQRGHQPGLGEADREQPARHRAQVLQGRA